MLENDVGRFAVLSVLLLITKGGTGCCLLFSFSDDETDTHYTV